MILSIKTDGFSHDSRLLSIGVKTHNSVKFWHIWDFESEERLLENFIEYFTGVDDKIVNGFNLLKFDIPFLLLKSRGLHGFEKFFRKINFSNVTDLFDILTFQNRGVIKGFNYYCEQHGIPRNFVSDNEMVEMYKNKRHADFERNFSEKLNSTNELFAKLFWGEKNE